ncbi:MAG TPA: DNA cytosine methyltransferase [Caulobacteraceae bacterium]|jgi:DNA (cytosine-5)-methyltransferase 1
MSALGLTPGQLDALGLPRKRIVVGFAGGGGACFGIRAAWGADPDAALNHWDVAIASHRKHFPATGHFLGDIIEVPPSIVCPGEPIGFAWFSPDCTDHSKAKGAAPKTERIRGLAWAILPWVASRRPDVLMLENVEEWFDWGPVYRREDDVRANGVPGDVGQPIKALRGETRSRFVARLERVGYKVEIGYIRAADVGVPTTRRRLVMIARCDGQPIHWPAPTHAPRKVAAAKGLAAYVGGWTCIDFADPCPSILMSREEARAYTKETGVKCKRPLVANTLRRIAKGVERHVMVDPFIVQIRPEGTVAPYLVPAGHSADVRTYSARDPLRTLTAASRGDFALVSPYLVPRYSERAGQEPRSRDLREPYPSPVPDGNGGSLVAACLSRQFGRSVGSNAADPVGATTAGGGGKTLLVAAALGRQFGSNVSGRDIREPLAAGLSGGGKGGGHDQLIAASLSSYYATGVGSSLHDPLRVVPTEDRHALIATWLEQAATGLVGHSVRDPVSTIVGKGCTQRLVEARLEVEGGPQGRRGRVLEFLWDQFGPPTPAEWADPAGTLRGRLRFGLVLLPDAAGDKQVWIIVDIGLRMLKARELARAMGLPREVDFATDADGRAINTTHQVEMIGNMVCPGVVRAVALANPPIWEVTDDERRAA